MKIKPVFFALICLSFFTLAGYAAQNSVVRLMSFGRINVLTVNVELFYDSACTVKCSYINWGTLEVNSNQTRLIYIKNVGDTYATLNFTVYNWVPPEAEQQLVLSWNYMGQTLQTNETVPVTFTLHASDAGDVSDFSFDIMITASREI